MPQALFDINIEALPGAREFLDRLSPVNYIDMLKGRVIGRASADLRRLYLRHLKATIRERTTRRTGNLLKAKAQRIRGHNIARDTLVIEATFPKTQYSTPAGRGRPGSSKSGQYAFVVNSHRRFIEEANSRFVRDPQVEVILEKHLRFVFADIINKLRRRRLST